VSDLGERCLVLLLGFVRSPIHESEELLLIRSQECNLHVYVLSVFLGLTDTFDDVGFEPVNLGALFVFDLEVGYVLLDIVVDLLCIGLNLFERPVFERPKVPSSGDVTTRPRWSVSSFSTLQSSGNVMESTGDPFG
jgi:hypothetical protein